MPRRVPSLLQVIGLLLACSAMPLAAQAEPADSTRLALARQLLELNRSTEQAITSMDAMLTSQRALNPRIPGAFWDRFGARVHESRDDFTAMVAGIYARHFSAAELRELIAFHRTPIGQRLIELQPQISRESMEAGQQWGARIGQAIAAELEAEGVTLEP